MTYTNKQINIMKKQINCMIERNWNGEEDICNITELFHYTALLLDFNQTQFEIITKEIKAGYLLTDGLLHKLELLK